MRLPEVHTLAGKLVETHEAGEFSFDRNCCLQRAFGAEREGMPRDRGVWESPGESATLTDFRAAHPSASESQLGHSTMDALFLVCF